MLAIASARMRDRFELDLPRRPTVEIPCFGLFIVMQTSSDAIAAPHEVGDE
jgi:hypothetical protein